MAAPFDPKGTTRHWLAGLLACHSLSAFPFLRTVAMGKCSSPFMGTHSSGHCSGFSPDSLLAFGSRRPPKEPTTAKVKNFLCNFSV